jgi:Zn-dependent peptidase ImmA (M78 family)
MTTGWLLFPDTDIIASLRELQPNRPVNWAEAHGVAERQATRLLQHFLIDEPPVPQFVISSLAPISVDWRSGWPTSGMTIRDKDRWRIVINGDEPRQRQRFSLAHEFKHILDDPKIRQLHAHLPAEHRQRRAERLCDYFAACLLMPRVWIKRDWYAGHQEPISLARRYYVSLPAMTTRLSDLGLGPLGFAGGDSQRHKKVKEVTV